MNNIAGQIPVIPSPQPRIYNVGSSTVTKLFELDLNGFAAAQLFPGFNVEKFSTHPEWMTPDLYDAQTGQVSLSVHTWVVRHLGKVLLVDTGAGNDKDRPNLKVLDHLHNLYLERLAALGVQPEEVDFVLLTHLHADHVGWNTRWDGARWVPTFPNATVICSDIEWRYALALSNNNEAEVKLVLKKAGLGMPQRVPVSGVFADSMAPLESTHALQRIRIDGSELLPGIKFLRAAGHSIDHAVILLTSEGQEAVFGGDLLHHPFEFFDPDQVSAFCEFPDFTRESRRRIADYVADRNALFFSAHFPSTSAGYATRSGSVYGWRFA